MFEKSFNAKYAKGDAKHAKDHFFAVFARYSAGLCVEILLHRL
jgi:hypothetical protein